MRRLMLLRHAKSDWAAPGMYDHERPLAARGRADAPRIGRYMLQHHLRPDHVIVSTAERTRETWSLVAGAWSDAPRTIFDPRIYEASPADILRAIADAPASVRTLLVIGHNPGLQETALLLAGSGRLAERRALAQKFPTAALAVIAFDAPDWAALSPGSGRLTQLVTPRAITPRAITPRALGDDAD